MKLVQAALRSVVLIHALSLAIEGHAANRNFTVADSIGVATFENPMAQFLVPAPAVSFSPDGAHFVVLTVRGVLSSNRLVSTIRIFDTAQVRAYLLAAGRRVPDSRILLRCSTASNLRPISFWRWSSDSRSILFLRADDDGVEHLEQVSLNTGRVATLSGMGQDVTGFDEHKGQVVYLARTPIGAGALYQTGGPLLPDVEDGTGESLLQLVFPNWKSSVLPTKADALYKVAHGTPVAVLSSTGRRPIELGGAFVPDTVGQKLALAPNGRLLLATAYVHDIPESWGRYRSASLSEKIASFRPDASAALGGAGLFYPQQYVLVNVEDGKSTPLIDAPIDFGSLRYDPVAGAWSADESRLAVTGVFPPLSRAATWPEARRLSSISPCAVAVIDLTSRRFSCPQPQATLQPSDTPFWKRKRVISLAWQDGNRSLIATYEALATPNEPSTVRYTEDRNGRWRVSGQPPPALATILRVYVRQAINRAPVLMAALPGSVARPLLDPNLQLKGIALGTASLYHWRYAGKLQTGALVTPPAFSAARRYPLVIQADPLNFAQFLVDGPSHSGFAARALAGHDIVVLQVPDIGEYGSRVWMEENAANYRAAIGQLARSGMIDHHRVGIIGWSHSGAFVLQSLEDDPSSFKVASIVEGSFNSYSEFLAQVDYWSGDAGEKYLYHYIGAWPWGDGLKVWLTRSPAFHTDRICAPILLQVTNPTALVFASWDNYAILRAQHKPVDLLYFRNGAHTLTKPRERFVDQKTNVDWFDYWLNGRKSSGPAMSGEYQRWDAMTKTLPPCWP